MCVCTITSIYQKRLCSTYTSALHACQSSKLLGELQDILAASNAVAMQQHGLLHNLHIMCTSVSGYAVHRLNVVNGLTQ